jgi:hypothetical protein
MEYENEYKNRKLHELEKAQGADACRAGILALIDAYWELGDNSSKVTADIYRAHFLEANADDMGAKFNPEVGTHAVMLKTQFRTVGRCRIAHGGTHYD